LGEVFFERDEFGAEDVVARAQDALEGGFELGLEDDVLAFEVE
jgi:hypothetical protein